MGCWFTGGVIIQNAQARTGCRYDFKKRVSVCLPNESAAPATSVLVNRCPRVKDPQGGG